MPLYDFEDINTGDRSEIMIKIADKPQFLVDNPHLKQVITAAALGDPVRLGIKRTPDSFNDVLKKAKNAHRGSTIQTR